MTLKAAGFRGLAAAGIASALILGDAHEATAQSTRYLNREVAAGKQIEFKWTNYNGATCRDNGYAKFSVVKRPKLGRFRVVRKRITQRSGQCRGKRFSTLLIYYVAGRKRGADTAAFAVEGGNRTEINLQISIR